MADPGGEARAAKRAQIQARIELARRAQEVEQQRRQSMLMQKAKETGVHGGAITAKVTIPQGVVVGQVFIVTWADGTFSYVKVQAIHKNRMAACA